MVTRDITDPPYDHSISSISCSTNHLKRINNSLLYNFHSLNPCHFQSNHHKNVSFPAPPWVFSPFNNFKIPLQTPLAKSQSVWGAFHQPGFMSSCLILFTRVCPVYLVDEFSPCVLWPLLIELMLVLLTFFWMVSVALLVWVVHAILGNGYGIKRQNYVALLWGSEISAGFHSRGFILSM